MALTSAFLFTNKTQAAHKSIQLYDLGINNYGAPETAKSETRYPNMTDQTSLRSEYIKYTHKEGKVVDSSLKPQYPSKAKSTELYGVYTEDMLVTTDSNDPTFEVDNPITIRTIICHDNDRFVTADKVEEVLARHISAFYNVDGTSKIANLMQGGTPQTNF